MKYKGLTIHLSLVLTLVLMLTLVGTVLAQDPGPNDIPTTELVLPPEPPIPYGSGEGELAVSAASMFALESVGPVSNGDFETGDLSGWGVYTIGGGNWYAYSGTSAPLSYLLIAAPPQGTYAATSDQRGPSVHILYQDITLPADSASNLTFTLYYHNWAGAFYTPATLDQNGLPNQQYRVDIIDPAADLDSVAAGDVLENVFQTQVGDPPVLPPTPFTFDLSPFAGQTIRLRFAEVDNQSYFQASVDNILLTLSEAQGVEPKTVSSDLQFPGDILTIDKIVTTPPISPKPDIYFLADTTGSMYSAIANVKANAAVILAQVAAQTTDPLFGAGNYRDFPYDGYAFQNNAVIDGQAQTLAAINSWFATGGVDAPEAQLFALDQIAEGAPGWRSGSTKIVVWFGDWPGHDPVCSAISGLGYDITEASVTAKLVAAGIRVIAISVTSGAGMDGDPTLWGGDYFPYCGTPGGTAGQATRIAAATGGVHLQNVTPDQVAAKILEGLQNLPATVMPQLDAACSADLLFDFNPASQTVTSGETAAFVETITVKSDALGGAAETCAIDWLINGVSAGPDFTQSISIYVNGPPSADAGGPYSGNEGSPISLDGTGSSDPDDDPLTYSWTVDSPLCAFDNATSAIPNLTCTDNGDFTVTLVVDDGVATDSDTAAVTVYNVPPTATFNAPEYVIAGDDFELSLTDPFDPSSADTVAGFTYAFDCGDGGGYGGLGFAETGDLSEWNLTVPFEGFAQVSSSYYSDWPTLYMPKTGSEFILMKTDGPGSYTTAARTFVAKAGETISGWAFFDARDYLPYNDNGQVTIRSGGTVLATLFSASVSTVGSYGETPWTYWEYTFTSDGTYTLEAKVANALDSSYDSYLGLDVLINAATCSTSPDEVGTRTVKGKIRDKDGGETEYTATVTILPPSAATDSALCYYDRQPEIPGQQFRLIFTPDMQMWPAYKLPASNPGQFFYNVFYTGEGPADFSITVPEPFVTQGAMPVHVYTDVSLVEKDGFVCFAPDLESEIYAGDFSGLSGLSDPGGFLYVAVHLDYGLKGTTGYVPNADNDALDATDGVTVLIPNLDDYTFSVSGSQTDSQTIQNVNNFKKISGLGGLVMEAGNPVAGATMNISLNGVYLGTVTTDEDGWYLYIYKYTGKSVPYTVEWQGSGLSKSGTMKANRFAEVNFP